VRGKAMQYNHDTFEQWWEFLELSKSYKSICELVLKHKGDSSEFPLTRLLKEIENNDKLIFRENKKINPIEKYMKMLAVYEKFGDVHHKGFEDWWENYNKPKSVKTKTGLDEYKEEKYRRINAAMTSGDEQLQLYEEIRGDIIYFPDTYVQLYVNIHSPVKNIKSHIGSVVKELKKQAEANQREELDARDEYLDILRLSLREKYTMNQIINELSTRKEKETDNLERSYRKKKQEALEILHKVEQGRFP
jgi:hypothetical protein